MLSIRRKLILNITILIVLVLSAVAGIVYEITRSAIDDKHRSVRETVELQYRDKRDEAMLAQSRKLASEAQSQFDPVTYRKKFEAALLTSWLLPQGMNSHISGPVWLIDHYPGPQLYRESMLLASEVKLTESEEMTLGYVQVNSDWGNVWRSKAELAPLPELDAAQFTAEETIEWFFDDVELSTGVTARRIRMKAPLSRFRTLTQPQATLPERAALGIAAGLRKDGSRLDRPLFPFFFGRGRPPSRGSFAASATPPHPTIYIQIAWNESMVPKLGELARQRDEVLARLDDENKDALAQLKLRLGGISAIALGVVVIGGWLLIGTSLTPLKRLSLAVSQVSARDFRLPIEPSDLPPEIVPVADRLKQTLQQLQAAFEREKRASADISHELRTPLAALTTTLEVALRKERTPESYRQTLEDCREIARQISHLVERMLMLAWLDAGVDKIQSEHVAIDQLVQGCAAVGKPLAEAHGLQFQVTAEKALTANTDADKLREVVMNLVHNAIEYNQPGGEVEILARSGSTGGVVVEVRDTGIGIPAEIHEKIFERFYRGDPSRNAAGVHAGLGLAIVKEYVDRLGGRLSIESTVGSGSRFRVELPKA
jgi:signal transduction histidine kinase